jgi:hypothetical protein
MCPQSPVTVKGEGMTELFAWKTKAGFAVHLLNYANPDMQRGWFIEAYPLGAQKVKMTLPSGFTANRVQLLAAGTQAPMTASGNSIEFTVPQVRDYEVAAIE